MSTENYKLLSWVNHNYLKEIQCGIQTAHASKVLERTGSDTIAYKKWSDNDIIVILQGGGHPYLVALHDIIEEYSLNYAILFGEVAPYGIFYEPELNFSATSVSVIISDIVRQWARDSIKTVDSLDLSFDAINTRAKSLFAKRSSRVEITREERFNFIISFLGWIDNCRIV